METDYVIIGGGVVGLSVAWGLLRRGLTVTVLDGDDGSFPSKPRQFWFSLGPVQRDERTSLCPLVTTIGCDLG